MWIPDSLSQSLPILDMTSEVTNPRVEYIIERVLPEEEITDNPHTSCVFVIDPKPPKICYRVYSFLYFGHLAIEGIEGDIGMSAYLCHYFFVLLYKGYYSLAVIFWNVFCLVLQLLLLHL